MAHPQVHERFRNSVKNGLAKVHETTGLDHAGLRGRFREIVAGDCSVRILARSSHLKRSMILQRRSQNLARFFFGAVAIPRRSPDRPEAGRAYG
jgi:hypothetical protein